MTKQQFRFQTTFLEHGGVRNLFRIAATSN